MKKNFITGFLSGLCGAIFLFMVVGTVIILVNGGKSSDINQGTKVEAQDNSQDLSSNQYGQIVSKLNSLEKLVDKYYLEDVDSSAYADGIYKGFISSLEDPYSTYYTKDEYNLLMESSSGVYQGIGASVSQDVKTGIITIVKPFKSGPAYKAGILPGDIIYEVEGEKVSRRDISEVVSKMKGAEGTTVNITIVRKGTADPIKFSIKREKINVPTIEYKMLANKIGYIQIAEFDDITISQFISAVDELESSGMKGLIVDVRNNPGGLLHSVVKILDRILPKGLIVYTEDKYDNREEEKAVDTKELTVPLAVLINGNSASASEIFAGAIQDYKKGTIIGTTSFGKGIVQRVLPLTDGTAVKLTVSKYFTPNGRNIHGTGIVPDIKVDLKDELKQKAVVTIEEDNQIQEAIKVLKKEMK